MALDTGLTVSQASAIFSVGGRVLLAAPLEGGLTILRERTGHRSRPRRLRRKASGIAELRSELPRAFGVLAVAARAESAAEDAVLRWKPVELLIDCADQAGLAQPVQEVGEL